MNASRLRRRRLLILGAVVSVVSLTGVTAAQYYRAERGRWLANATVASLRQAAEQHPDDSEVKFQLAFRLSALGQASDARRLMEELVVRHPRSEEYWFGLAKAAGIQGDVARAVEAYERTLEINPRAANARYTLGQLLAEVGLSTEAIRHFETAGKDAPPNEVVDASWAACLYRIGRVGDAWDKLVASLKRIPMQDQPFMLLGRLAEELGKRREAEPLLRERVGQIRAYPTGVARAPLARLLVLFPEKPGDLAEAEQLARVAVKDSNPKAAFYAALGLVLLKKGDVPGALGALKRGRELDPRDVETLRLLAQAYERSGQQREAQAVRSRMLLPFQKDPRFRNISEQAERADTAQAHLGLAVALQQAGRPADAAEACCAGLASAPNNIELLRMVKRCRAEAIAGFRVPKAAAVPNAELYQWAETE